MPDTKYPKEYMKPEEGLAKDPFRPEFRYDTRGRLVMPLPGYAKFMLAVEPGSKRIGQSSEDEAGKPGTEPNSLKTGYLHVETEIRLGPEGGWVVVLAGGDAERPIQYGNEGTGVTNFYVDKDGNVFLRGTIEAVAGGIIGGFTIKTDYLESDTAPVACGMAPLDWPFWAGDTYANRAAAPFRVNNAGQIWCSNITISGGSVAWSTVSGTPNAPDDNADVTAASAFVTVTYPANQTDFQTQIDGKIVSWFTGVDPSGTWAGTDASHEGDMWWNTGTKKLRRYTGAAWSADIEDQKAIDAYNDASTAQDTADGKRRIFTATPTTPYNVGDLWAAGPAGAIKKCKIERLSGAYQAGDWELASEYDNTQDELDAGASIDNAKANGITLIQGGYIKTGIISASNINAGTLTGVRIETASGAGQRIILYSTLMTFYDAAAAQASIWASGGDLLIQGAQVASNIFIAGGGGSGHVSLSDAGTVRLATTATGITITGNIVVTGIVDGVDIAAHDGGAIGTYHTGVISITMHGDKTTIPDSHHFADSYGYDIRPRSIVCHRDIEPLFDNFTYIGDQYKGFKSFYFTDVYNPSIYRGSEIMLNFGADVIVCPNHFEPADAGSKNLGSGDHWWAYVNCISISEHTSKWMEKEKAWSIINGLKKDSKTGKVDKKNLPDTIRDPAPEKDGVSHGMLIGPLLLSCVQTIKDLEKRLIELET